MLTKTVVREVVECTHCGLDVPAGLVDREAELNFCCAGCEAAFAILHSHGLDSYYRLGERRITPVHTTGRNYEEFDHETFAALYVRALPNGLSETELYLEGVHCASCVWLVERVPLILSGLVRAELDVRRSVAVVQWNPAVVQLSELARTLDNLGYAPHPFRGVKRSAMRRREDRAMLVRIGIAGAIAINVMLAALALYSGEANGMEPRFQDFFRWISLILIVPAFVWPGRVFFTGAWASVRTRSLHMDIPIAIALAAGLVRGAINTISNNGPIYFDGLAILIFALLVGRFLQQRGQRMAADSAELLQALAPISARIVEGDTTREVPTEAVVAGMVLDVRAGESFAADGTVVRGRSSVNAALLTGESEPQRVATGDAVYAGTHNIESPVQVLVNAAGETSRIARLLRQVEESSRRRAPVVQLANRMAGIFVVVVLVLAVATFAVKWQLSSKHALDDAIALLIVTCPCALALATPLSVTVAVGRAARRGILVKGGDALELLAKPGTLVLDKTGTLTEGKTTLVNWVGPDWARPMILALEAGSSHPVAQGFARAWSDVTPSVARDVVHVAGGGVYGMVGAHVVRIGSPRFVHECAAHPGIALSKKIATLDAKLTPVHIAVDGHVIAAASFGDAIRADSLQSLHELRMHGWRTVMLSGDSVEVARSVGHALKFSSYDIHGAASPEDKLAFVESLKAQGHCVVMVGDGVNDAAAMAAANVGLGVHGGAEACLAVADAYLTRPGLGVLVELIVGSHRTLRVIRRNFLFSIGYNIVGASLAIGGLLTPLIAAVLMPASSISVILGAFYGFTFLRQEARPS